MLVRRILAIASVLSLVYSPQLASSQPRHNVTPPPISLTVDIQGMTSLQVSDLRCLALNVYYEARGTSYRNQLAVAFVVRNRQEISKQTVCQVVYAPGQFTWTGYRMAPPREPESWHTAQTVALVVLRGGIEDITNGATHFHESRIRPTWARSATTTARIGAHTFHRLTEVAEAP